MLSRELRDKGLIRVVTGILVFVEVPDGGGWRILNWSKSGGRADVVEVGCDDAVGVTSRVEMLLLPVSASRDSCVISESSLLLLSAGDGQMSGIVC